MAEIIPFPRSNRLINDKEIKTNDNDSIVWLQKFEKLVKRKMFASLKDKNSYPQKGSAILIEFVGTTYEAVLIDILERLCWESFKNKLCYPVT